MTHIPQPHAKCAEGSIVDGIGYPGFFIFTTLIGVPALILVWLAGRKLAIRDAA